MKTILVSLAHLDRNEDAIEAAVQIGQKNDSHIIGYYPIPGPSLIVYASPGGGFPVDDSLTRLYENRQQEIQDRFEDRMRRSGLNYEWREDRRDTSDITTAILEHGREVDLIVLGHDAPESKFAAQEAGFVADIILGAGRPVLIVPPVVGKDLHFDKVAVGWNASRESCRAAFDSLPILDDAKHVILAWVNPEKKPDKAGKLPGTELASALARHDVKVEAKGLSNRDRTGRALVNFVKEDDIDLLVMGAYGRTRLQEQILGGVTEHVLKNLPCPVLFSN